MQNLLHRWFFNLWYFQKPPWDTGISPPELLAFIRTHPPGRALDLGCGTGTNVVTLARHGWQTTGVDFVSRAIRTARRKARLAGVQADLRVDDVSRLKGIQGTFDLVLDIGCYHSLSHASRVAYMDNLLRLLSPLGTYLMYAMLREPGESSPGLSPSDVDLLSQRLTLVERRDGTERGLRPSAWFEYRRCTSSSSSSTASV